MTAVLQGTKLDALLYDVEGIARTIVSTDTREGRRLLEAAAALRAYEKLVADDEAMELLRLTNDLLEQREGHESPPIENEEQAEAYFAAEDLVSHHVGESQGGMCWLCYLQHRVKEYLESRP